MRKGLAVIASAVFLVLAPGTVAGLVPWLIARSARDTISLPLAAHTAGLILVGAGALVLLDSFARFALQGLGTPAPVLPTRHLVVTGLYRHVRNPMYIAVIAVIAGQALFLGNLHVLLYGALVWLAFNLFVMLYEEPTLRSTYGKEYEDFCSHVPRWIPRLRPWKPDA